MLSIQNNYWNGPSPDIKWDLAQTVNQEISTGKSARPKLVLSKTEEPQK